MKHKIIKIKKKRKKTPQKTPYMYMSFFPPIGFIYLFLFLLLICAYNDWVISPPLPGRNYFALISNFVEERV
jgi:hypothetical protein